jgi:D-glycero-alpha-D-manno-heptose 1-phosphate guanylyltransferase
MSDMESASASLRGEHRDTAAVILAGGYGTRIGHLLGDLPKPMMPVAGRPFLEWIARFLAKQGVRNFVISTGYRAEAIERHFGNVAIAGCTFVCACEDKPLGTAGGFLNAVDRSRLDRPFWLVANGDSMALTGLAGLLAAVQAGPAAAAILGIRVSDASRFGTLEAEPDGSLVRFSEKRPGAGLINAGIYALSRECVAGLPGRRPLSFESECFPSLLAEGQTIRVLACQAPFIDIGTEESLLQADRFITEHAGWFQ